MALTAGDTLLNGHYRIIRQLGRGGFGFVYLAHDNLIGESVAIKELIPALVGDETMLKRFLAEAKATMHLSHDRIVRTHNVFSDSGNYYIAMECMTGGSLEERLRNQGSLSIDEAVRIAVQVCEGLSYAHKRGVVHCDLKPANILFAANGSAKVTDFGIAHVSEEVLTRTWQTPAGFVAGTLPYMSPEQAEGVRDDPRIDIYALGAVLYRMLAAKTYVEFDTRETPGATADNVYRIRNQAVRAPSTHNRQIPQWLDEVVLKALAKGRQDRYLNADAMYAALMRKSVEASALPPSSVRVATSAQGQGTRLPSPRPASQAQAKAFHSWLLPMTGGVAALLVLTLIALLLLVDGTGSRNTLTPDPIQSPALEATTHRAPTSSRPTNTARPERPEEEVVGIVTSESTQTTTVPESAPSPLIPRPSPPSSLSIPIVVEVAADKPTTASSFYQGGSNYSFKPSAVVDRKTNELHCTVGVERGNSYWLLADRRPGWVQVDLEQDFAIVKLRWLNTHNGSCNDRATTSFYIALSQTGDFSGEEAVVHRGEMSFAATPEYQEISLSSPVPARYVRFYVNNYHGEGGGLNEIEVYAEITVRSGTEVAAGKPTTASSFYQGGSDCSFKPSAVVDRKTDELHCSVGVERGNTYWLLADHRTGWLQVDLEEELSIVKLRWLNTHNGNCNDRATTSFHISLSQTGAFSGEEVIVHHGEMSFSTDPKYQEISLTTPTTARYVRFYVDGYHGGGGGLNEFEVYAEE